jgi:peptide/nickel transport system permease protein
VASVVVFAVLELLPGNAAAGDPGRHRHAGIAWRRCRAKLGLDRPALQRYTDWVGGWYTQGRTAESVTRYGTPTSELIVERLQRHACRWPCWRWC